MEVGGQRVGVAGCLPAGNLAGEQLHLTTRHQLHDAGSPVGGVPEVIAVGLLRVPRLELRRVVVAPGDLPQRLGQLLRPGVRGRRDGTLHAVQVGLLGQAAAVGILDVGVGRIEPGRLHRLLPVGLETVLVEVSIAS